MRSKFLSFVLLAGTVAGCASNPPPPPPMAEAPPPAPPPAMMTPTSMMGTYRGTAELASDAPARCARMNRPVTVRVLRNNSFTLGGMRGTIGADGAISSSTRRGMSMMGTASATGLDVTQMKGTCSYHYTLAKA